MEVHRVAFRCSFYFLIFLGFSYQAITVCLDYFKYPVITNISMAKLPRERFLPTIILCTDAVPIDRYFNRSIGQLFREDLREEIVVEKSLISEDCKDRRDITKDVEVRRLFGNHGKFCVSIGHKSNYSRDWESMTSCIPGVTLQVIVRRTFLNKLFRERQLVDMHTFLDVTHPDFDGLAMTPLCQVLSKGLTTLISGLSYLMVHVKLSRPPYASKCREYRESGLKSKFNCINECIRRKTIERRFLSDSVIMEESNFMNSDFSIIPFYGVKNSTSQTQDQKIKKDIKNIKELEVNDLIDKNLFVKKVRDECNKLCCQPDCDSKILSTVLVTSREVSSPNGTRGFTLHDMNILPPKQAVVVVKTSTKIYLIDFFVYLSSCLSFWFGFCPLTLTNKIDKKFFIDNKNEQVNQSNRVLRELKSLRRQNQLMEEKFRHLNGLIDDIWSVVRVCFR